MHSVQLGIVTSLTPQIHLTEHVQRRFFPGTGDSWTPLLTFHRTNQLPAVLVATEAVRLAVLLQSVALISYKQGDTNMSGCNDLVFTAPDQASERQ